MSQAIEAAPPVTGPIQADWELDYYSRPILEPDGKKRWELLICSSPRDGAAFRWCLNCPAGSVNSSWLRQALEQALAAATEQGFAPPRRLRCWRGSMRTMVQRAAEPLSLEVVPSRRCYALVEWLQERMATIYPNEEGFMAGPLAPPPLPIQPLAVPLPEAARGDRWSWASLPLGALREAADWDVSFAGLVPLSSELDDEVLVSGLRLFSTSRSLAIAGWLAGLEPVRLEVDGNQLVLEAGMEDRWLRASSSSPCRAARISRASMASGSSVICPMPERTRRQHPHG
jgi:hypothetical protein